MKLILVGLAIIAVYVIILKMTAPYRERKRAKKCEDLLQVIDTMLSKLQYQEIIDMINKEKVFRSHLPIELRRKITEVTVQCFEKLNKVKDAVVCLTNYLAYYYERTNWPEDLYNKWLSLYKSIEPFPVEELYFCQCCGLHPDVKRLLDSAIEKGCRPPVGFPGECKSEVVIHFGGPKKTKNIKRNKGVGS